MDDPLKNRKLPDVFSKPVTSSLYVKPVTDVMKAPMRDVVTESGANDSILDRPSLKIEEHIPDVIHQHAYSPFEKVNDHDPLKTAHIDVLDHQENRQSEKREKKHVDKWSILTLEDVEVDEEEQARVQRNLHHVQDF
ncbi:uncharacterized protein LOC128206411 [Mya arenaria]|uniref:uncharacterized protein LOC128206411 n=1 Tax=Mya arenaria TaxID=6604 RepID=UPI0022E3A2AF|nr:uncharacterized protein LOC128206411 [Mya arenaria]XP_052764783.1 uncharacterized protein LOC128206411 [Mya arenaria]XP_052764784.1 uncharacterized protein LOC128206411 [Mya arenaria]XP_052764785.1 uncharacterized protein LOC128206411 [Mya arenaria]